MGETWDDEYDRYGRYGRYGRYSRYSRRGRYTGRGGRGGHGRCAGRARCAGRGGHTRCAHHAHHARCAQCVRCAHHAHHAQCVRCAHHAQCVRHVGHGGCCGAGAGGGRGRGPVGLLVACELAGYGVRTVVVEEREGISARPKATTLHARAVQCLVRRGYLAGVAGGPRRRWRRGARSISRGCRGWRCVRRRWSRRRSSSASRSSWSGISRRGRGRPVWSSCAVCG
ncbi:FAD-dependent monooxygenase (plasmid) [Streptomyces sp. AD2-2]|nr:FAD-dependent monooxygenase [Streptomyces sp. AD2-2]